MITQELIKNHVNELFGQNMHIKRVQSLSNATLGTIEAGSLAIHAIGSGLAQANSLQRKSAIKQVDRLLSNPKFNVDSLQNDWVPYIIGARQEVVVSLDWTAGKIHVHADV